jgi:hypothetical protein
MKLELGKEIPSPVFYIFGGRKSRCAVDMLSRFLICKTQDVSKQFRLSS